MIKCDWCGKKTDKLEIYEDAFNTPYSICDKCFEKVNNNICRKCGKVTDPMMIIDGCCTACAQLSINEKRKKKEEALNGVGFTEIDDVNAGAVMTEKDFDEWQQMGNCFSFEDMQKSVELRYIWIMVKLSALGIYDNEVISNNFEDIQKLLDRNMIKLRGNKCRLIIAFDSRTRKIVKEGNIIDSEGIVYILDGVE